ncbi:MAG: class I SAM-dependent methyltransferase [Planctomycetota bacterium]|nr:class I SAM-dependent methyltransferase [Planctomycetota bacterium]
MSATTFPFDDLAADYDERFCRTRIGTLMRQAVWRRLAARFSAGQRILELNCGTGEDAVYLGRNGVRVLATDRSAKMVEQTQDKVAAAGLQGQVQVRQLAFEDLDRLQAGPFDGVLSNFGGLNCVSDRAAVARALAGQLRAGASAVLCVMGPLVVWEWIWYLAHGQPRVAFRRLTAGGVAWRGLRIHYPSIRRLRREFGPWFHARRTSALGALLPPPFMESWAGAHPQLLAHLEHWERRLERLPPLPWLADHYLLELERV